MRIPYFPILAAFFLLSSCSSAPEKDGSGHYFLKDEPYTGKHIEYYGPKMPREELMIQNGVVLVRMSYDTDGVHRKTAIYNTAGQLQELMELNEKGQLCVHRFYSAANHLQEKRQYNGNGKLLWREVHSYNSLGIVIETAIYDSTGKLCVRKIISPDGRQLDYFEE